jgi:hypothetical protein
MTAKSLGSVTVAELMAEKSMLERKRQLQLQQHELVMFKEQLEIDTAIAKAKAKELVFAKQLHKCQIVDVVSPHIDINMPNMYVPNQSLSSQVNWPSTVSAVAHLGLPTPLTARTTASQPGIMASNVSVSSLYPVVPPPSILSTPAAIAPHNTTHP